MPEDALRNVGTNIHATAVEKAGAAVLLFGPSGSGKSDLALRLLDRGYRLIGDDRIILERRGTLLTARVPEALRGFMEVRGVGLVPTACVDGAVPVRLALELVAADTVERLPEAAKKILLGIAVDVFSLWALEASAPLKVDAALGLVLSGNVLSGNRSHDRS